MDKDALEAEPTVAPLINEKKSWYMIVKGMCFHPFHLKRVKSLTKGFKTPPTPAMIRAGEFLSSLGTEFPSCVKMTVKSQVTYGNLLSPLKTMNLKKNRIPIPHYSITRMAGYDTGLVVDMLKILDKGYSRSRTRQIESIFFEYLGPIA
uniref:Uncharacterized protein n=1 Tax=Lactuca sativa TaxID=4236 RepID=A0A9R1V2H4_LACSA|nr:hypothetical protein LSAT_V11C700369780 [Lactuca sativa]